MTFRQIYKKKAPQGNILDFFLLDTIKTTFLFYIYQFCSLSKCLSSTKPPLPCKISGCLLAISHYSFCKMLHLKSLTVFWIRLCLDNCSVLCTVTLCYVLHQTNSEDWHIQNCFYSWIFRYIQSYSALLKHIHVYWGDIKALFGLLHFMHIQYPV